MQWVLIRGIVSEKFHWGDFPSQLASLLPGHEFTTADLIGNGQSREQLSPLSPHLHIRELKNQISFQKPKKILLGFSLGGMVALEWAFRHPEEVEALVLINTSLGFSPPHKRLQPSAIKKIFLASLKQDLSRKERMILEMTTSSLGEDQLQAIAMEWGAYSQKNPIKAINFFRQIGLAMKIPKREIAPTVPILLLSSALDQVVHPDCSKEIARNWNLPHHVHPTAGHDLTLEDPQWVAQKIAAWIKEWRANDPASGLQA